MFEIKFNTGAGDFEIEGTLAEAMAAADEAVAYTQTNIEILGDDEHYARLWYGVEYDDTRDYAENPICFGKFGFYDDWQEI